MKISIHSDLIYYNVYVNLNVPSRFRLNWSSDTFRFLNQTYFALFKSVFCGESKQLIPPSKDLFLSQQIQNGIIWDTGDLMIYAWHRYLFKVGWFYVWVCFGSMTFTVLIRPHLLHLIKLLLFYVWDQNWPDIKLSIY